MAVISTANHPKALWPGVHAWFGMNYDEHPMECDQLFDVATSDKAWEEVVQSTSFGLAPIKTQGGSISYDSNQQGYTTRATHVVYALGYIVTREELEDNLYESVSMSRARSLAFSMRQTEEVVCANVYNRAFNNSYVFGDGLELCSTVHVQTGGGTWSNELATPAALSETSIEDLMIQIAGATNDRGLQIALIPQSLVIPRQLMFEAERILKSTQQNDSGNNALNALRSMGVLPKGVIMNHYLTDSNNWFIRTNAPAGMLKFNRRAVEFTKDNDFNTENALAKATRRFSVTCGDPRAVYGSAPA